MKIVNSDQDKSLSNGIFFLDLLAAVEPRVVDWQLVTKGETSKFIVVPTRPDLFLQPASSKLST